MSNWEKRLLDICTPQIRFPNNINYVKRTKTNGIKYCEMFKMRFALGIYRHSHTYEQIGEDFEISRERARQRIGKIYRELLEPENKDLLNSLDLNERYIPEKYK